MSSIYLECGDFVGFGGAKFGKVGKMEAEKRRRFRGVFLKNRKNSYKKCVQSRAKCAKVRMIYSKMTMICSILPGVF